jgi:hypothetical protein
MKQASLPRVSTCEGGDDFDLILSYLQYTREFSESPPKFHMFTLLATLASIVGRARYIVQGEDTIYPNVYLLVVALSSLYKKTSSIGLLKKWLVRLECMADRFIGQIGSPEGLFAALRENGGNAVAFYSELGLLLSQTAGKKYMGETLEMINDLYDCPDFYNKRLAGGLRRAEKVCFNLVGASQLDSLTKYVKESDLLSGFLPRFAVVFSDDLQPHIVRRPPPNQQLQNKILKGLNAIRTACKSPAEMNLTEQAWKSFEAWATTKHRDALLSPPQLKPMYGRLESHALKFAIIISLTRDPETLEIDQVSAQAGCSCAEFILRGYRRLVMEELTFTANERRLKRVSDVIKEAEEINHRDLMSRTRFKPRDLEEYTRMLTIMGKIELATGKRGGKVYRWSAEC